MKAFMKKAKKALRAADKPANATCKTCHTSMNPEWELKPEALSTFKEWKALLD